MIGGYKILDLKGQELQSGEKVVLEDSYDTIERSRKATLVEGLNVGGVEYDSAFYDFISTAGAFEATLGKITIKIENDNGVTVTVSE